jgi:hypothetical protein
MKKILCGFAAFQVWFVLGFATLRRTLADPDLPLAHATIS